MAEKTIVVCDVCGRPATEMVTIKTSRANFVKDLCAQHVTELTAGARKPRPGRPRKMGATSAAGPRRRGRPRKTTATANGRRKTSAASNGRRKKSTRRTTSGRRKAQASPSG
jgi:hypothetical protein